MFVKSKVHESVYTQSQRSKSFIGTHDSLVALEKKEGDFMKKKVLKCIGIIILVIIAFLVIHTVRNMIIIKNLSEKAESYKNANNYYVKTVSSQGSVMENFTKNGCYLMKLVNTSETGLRTLIRYSDGNIENTYIEAQTENGTDKVAMLNSNSLPSFNQITNWFYTDDFKSLLLMSLMARIRSVEQNEKDCYEVTYVYSSNILMPAEGEFAIYIEKETGLTVKNKNGAIVNENGTEEPIVIDYEYKFDSVTDEDLVEPDISEYKIQENN